MIIGIALILIGVAATYFISRACVAIVLMQQDVAATNERLRQDALTTRKQVKEVLKHIQRTDAHATRILERAYTHQQEINSFMANPNVRAAIRHAEDK